MLRGSQRGGAMIMPVSPEVSLNTDSWQESRWPPLIAILVAGALYAVLPSNYVLGGQWFGWIIPSLEVVLVIVAASAPPRAESNRLRNIGITLAALITVANASSLVTLVIGITQENGLQGRDLTWAAIDIWVTNIIIFAVWYWEIDGGGPKERAERAPGYADFLFPQYQLPGPWTWRPAFLDYLYIALTNASSFAPADSLPMTTRVKAMMSVQSLISLGVILIVAARAINTLH